jgi:hypothetical protein
MIADSVADQRHGSEDPDPDPDPPQNVMDPQHWLLRNTKIDNSFKFIFCTNCNWQKNLPELTGLAHNTAAHIRHLDEAGVVGCCNNRTILNLKPLRFVRIQ